MLSISAVLFDFGKVLSGPPDPASWRAMQEVSGLTAEALDREYWLPRDDYDRGTLTGEAYWDRVAGGGGIPLSEATRQKLLALDVDLWTQMNDPMLAWVHELHDAGIRTGILSNIGDAMEAGIRAKFEWIGRFDYALWSHAWKLRKPEPAIYAAAAEGLNVPPEEILFIDDKKENIEGAEAAGMHGVLYTDHAGFEAEMVRRGYGHLLHPADTLSLAKQMSSED